MAGMEAGMEAAFGKCAFCSRPADQRLGPLQGPVGDSRHFVHRCCALWSPEVRRAAEGGVANRCPALPPTPIACTFPPLYAPPPHLAQVHESPNGALLRVLEAVRRGRQLKCSCCGRRGASIGCRVVRCKRTMHVPCAQQVGAMFYVNHCVACPDHARRFKDALHPQ